MKKILVIALAVVMMVSVFALTACAQPQVVEGEYSYKNSHDATGASSYGCKVKVTVVNGTITKVEVEADTDKFFNVSAGWTDNYQPDGNPTEGKKAWLAQRDSFAQSFVGMTVEEVNAIVVECDDKSQPKTITGVDYVTGATQSSGRVILAIQNALSKLAA